MKRVYECEFHPDADSALRSFRVTVEVAADAEPGDYCTTQAAVVQMLLEAVGSAAHEAIPAFFGGGFKE